MKTYVTINNDRSIVYFTGEDADADMCHRNKKSVHQWKYSKIVQIGVERVKLLYVFRNSVRYQTCRGQRKRQLCFDNTLIKVRHRLSRPLLCRVTNILLWIKTIDLIIISLLLLSL